ncbi:TPA: hypothetical protein DEW47_03575 [Patescibacteria group bacterium]|nr:MAG: hypothetical protein UT71_C0001G0053 [Parcubacteria group bacterium GW2011_GWF2_40_10]KKR46854.1 MAG: hypothetical protein UT83_C0017G0006 [Parcubacteria group bacterium GW2011_GWA2_40_143]KKR60311.1 MAG: hypothetical protein UT97_C0002G0011 [Parcubacteria group bacterium GW2011_GWC2_40_31]KKR76220.1 MAG: hypothetical protein UU20_C0030G0007 [Parcubacteria group bacterium GW2011_GWE2_40_8]KKR82402.1 MAG: hypothetical protein UU28_C0010G0021 [Parcubacteria group bacterium GW2011_GWD2_40_
MENNNGESSLEKLKKRLYKRDDSFKRRNKREDFAASGKQSLPSSWQADEEQEKKIKPFKPMKYIIFISLFFLLVLSGFAFYVWNSGSNIVSTSNVGMEISGPVYVEGGQMLDVNLSIKNNNAVSLELADLIIDYPSNSFTSLGESLSRERTSLGDIEPGKTINKNIDVTFFGLEDEEKKIKVTLEYRTVNSNAIFAKEAEYAVKITKSPIGLSLSLPKETISGGQISMDVEIVSNSETLAKRVRLEAKYPPGFKFSGSSVKPSESDNTWLLGDIGPLQKKKITIKGFLDGQNQEERTFVFSVGTLGEDKILRVYGSASEKIAIKKTPLNLSMLINGQNEEKNVIAAGETARVNLEWENNLNDYIRDLQIELKLDGEAYEESSISVSRGLYRTFDDTILWTPNSLSDLSSIKPGDIGKTQLSFKIKNPLPIYGAGDKDFAISLEANISGKGTSADYENKIITDSVKKEIMVASGIRAIGRTLYFSGSLENDGPIPPEVGEDTSYTVVWSLANNSNDLSDAKITATIPPYVEWMDSFSPSSEDVVFDESNSTITWNIGDLAAGTGLIRQAREISFQLLFSPSLIQAGTVPEIVSEARFEAYDEFVEEMIYTAISALDINLSKDPLSNDSKNNKVGSE